VQTDTPETKQVFSDLDAALYAGKEIDVEDTKKRLGAILKATHKIKAPTDKQRANMGGLNPT